MPTRPSTPARRSAAPATPKLRDSCHACASSKIKCHKEKPTCSRCAKRGLTCEYFVTKRPGRKLENRSTENTSPTTNVTQAVPRSNWSTTNPMSSGTDYSTLSNLIQPSPRQNTPGDSSDIFPNLLSPVDPSLSSALTNLSTDFDDLFASPISVPVPETSDSDMLGQSQLYSSSKSGFDSNGAAALLISDDMFSVFEEAVSEPPNLSKPRSPPNSRASPTSDAQSYQGFPASDSPCCCLIRALGLLKQLFPNTSTACTSSNKQGYENTTRQLPTIQTVIVENEQTIQAINNMLQCPCSQDGYLLAIMSLIIFKVLDWYAAAARETPVVDEGGQSPTKSHHSQHFSDRSEHVLQYPTVVGSFCLDDEYSGRMAAQLVLSELHRVQRLMNQLSQKLKAHGTTNGAVGMPNSAVDGQISLWDGEITSTFSAKTLDQLEADLRKHLRTLSLEIVGMLRRD